jgi:hypothetical protein
VRRRDDAAGPHIRKHIAVSVVAAAVFRSGTRRVHIAATPGDISVPERDADRHACNSPADVVGRVPALLRADAANCTRPRRGAPASAAERQLPQRAVDGLRSTVCGSTVG